MQEKIQKLFSFFRDIKNQPFYTSCISQILQIYQKCPQSLKIILYNLKELIFSQTKQVRLRLKHRQICASIISKLNARYVITVQAFINQQSNFQVQSFQLDSNAGQQFKMTFSEQLWQNVNFLKVIQQSKPLYSSQRDYQQADVIDQQQSQKKFFQHFHEIKQATMMNMEELLGQMNVEDKDHENNHAQRGKKYNAKINKLRMKNQQRFGNQQLIISNPFNLMYQICIQNFLHPQWELRHLSTLIIKQLLLNAQFLGFAQSIQIPKLQSIQKRFQFLSQKTRSLLEEHKLKKQFRQKIFHDIAKHCMILLSLDRFADYQSDESHIIVRIQAAQILKICFDNFTKQDQMKMYKIIKKLFDQSSDPNKSKAFTWQIKHSFLYFLTLLVNKNEYLSTIFKVFQESFLKLLATDQFDQIILCVCKCFNKLVGESFFQNNAMERVNQQLWNIVQTLDDISISTKQTLALLGNMFNAFKFNESNCLSKVKKYFTSKIPQVRLQLYSLLTLLYKRNFKIDYSVLDINLIQYCQAIYVQKSNLLLDGLQKLTPYLFQYVLKTNKVQRLSYFINRILLFHDTMTNTINTLFKMCNQNQNQLTQNDYMYINQEQKLSISAQIYLDKRVMKFAKVIAHAFKYKLDGLKQLVQDIQHDKIVYHPNKDPIYKDSKGIYFLLLLYCNILKLNQLEQHDNNQPSEKSQIKVIKHCKSQFFVNLKNKMLNILKTNYTSLIDPNIIELRKQFIKIIQKIVQNGIESHLSQPFAHFKSQNWKSHGPIIEFHKKLVEIFDKKSLQDANREDFKVSISILQVIVNSQKTLLKQMKVLASYILIKISQPQQPKQLNQVIKSIQQIALDDRYQEISKFTAEAIENLSVVVMKRKEIVYSKINKNLIEAIGKKYNKSTTGLKDKQVKVNWRFQGNFMEAISIYIKRIGKIVPKWINDFGQCFFKDIQIIDQLQKNQKLYLLSGAINSLLSLNSESFIKQLLESMTKVLNYYSSTEKRQKDKINYPLLLEILEQSFIYLSNSKNYTKISNLFFSWFLKHLREYSVVLYQILEKVGKNKIQQISAVCSLFVMQIVRSVSVNDNKIQSLSMSCLSNLIVGVYTNIQQIPFSQQLQVVSEEGIEFVRNFKDANKFDYKIDIKHLPEIELRDYQKEGISWLGFLTKHNLNGALCDDMGLGKTLQLLTVIQNQYNCLKIQSQINKKQLLNSLIVVPTTIMQHWVYEHQKYFVSPICKATIVSKSQHFQKPLFKQPSGSLIITNYNFLQRKIQNFLSQSYKFVILDEGHIIKNVKTKKFKAVKQIISQHRFILTGTPIQNRLKQLWGLFDFLMPEYLSTEQNFKKTYQKLFEVNLTTFKEDELMFSETQRKTLQKLHFKVMPFIMRRLKNDVLSQLPNKIINDYYCELTKVQSQMYKQFENKCFHEKNQKAQNQEDNVLKTLTLMRKILNHPALIGGVQQLNNSGKFIALNDLFDQLGFSESQGNIQNKVILFARSNSTINLIQKLFMKEVYPKVKYLKLTGQTPIGKRFTVAQTFNGDSQYKVLLVTTRVGGEGLNLCSANIVIMFDHDYNPCVDMQAIDRAHRIGQKRVVNVYRLIMKDTLQERIMGIQKFKTNLANAIVNIDNASIKNLKESKLPDLLQNMEVMSQDNTKSKSINESFFKKLTQQMQNEIHNQQYQKKY